MPTILPGSLALCGRGSTTQCSTAVWQRTKGDPLLTGPQQCCSVPKEFHYPLLPSSVALYLRSPTTRCSLAVWRCTVGVPLPIAPQQCGSELKEPHRGRLESRGTSAAGHSVSSARDHAPFWGTQPPQALRKLQQLAHWDIVSPRPVIPLLWGATIPHRRPESCNH